MLPEMDDMIHPILFGNLDGVIGAAIVNDEDFNQINTCQMSWKSLQGLRQGIGLVKTGYLDNELHRGWHGLFDKYQKLPHQKYTIRLLRANGNQYHAGFDNPYPKRESSNHLLISGNSIEYPDWIDNSYEVLEPEIR